MDKIIEKAKQFASEKGYEDIQFIALTGSILIKEEKDLNDIDVLVVIKNAGPEYITTKKATIDNQEYDFFFEDLEKYKNRLEFKIKNSRTIYNIYNKFYNIIYGENPYSFDPFEHKEGYKEKIKKKVKKAAFNPKSTKADPSWKHFVAPYLFFTIIDSGKYELTDEMIKTAASIYAGESKQIKIIKEIGDRFGLKLNHRIRNKHYLPLLKEMSNKN